MIHKMNNSVEIITIGDELLIGQVIDTNSAWMGEKLNENGFCVKQITSIPDDKSHILTAIANAFNNADVILITGGLGPTKDDITKKSLCEFFNTELIFDEASYDNVKKFIRNRPQNMDNELNRQQAMVPKSCTPILNKEGTAPILWFERINKILVSLPGVPHEMECAMTDEILPRLKDFFECPSRQQITMIVYGYGESALALKISDWENQLPNGLKLAYLPQSNYVKLRLSGESEDQDSLKESLDREVNKLTAILGKSILAYEDIEPEKILTNILKEKKLTISTAESCTGGTIASLLAKHPGSSSFYKGSVVSYCNEVKHNILGVKSETLETVGAVSQDTVEQMAKGVCQLLNTDIGISVSGIAGPDGGTDELPVGTIWIAVANHETVVSKRLQLDTSRSENINKATIEAIFLAKEFAENKN